MGVFEKGKRGSYLVKHVSNELLWWYLLSSMGIARSVQWQNRYLLPFNAATRLEYVFGIEVVVMRGGEQFVVYGYVPFTGIQGLMPRSSHVRGIPLSELTTASCPGNMMRREEDEELQSSFKKTSSPRTHHPKSQPKTARLWRPRQKNIQHEAFLPGEQYFSCRWERVCSGE